MAARVCWDAFASTVVLQVGDAARLADAQAAVRKELEDIDRACSRFRVDSELSDVNARAGETCHIGTLLADAIEISLRAAAITDGAIDPTVGRCLQIAGYDRDWALVGDNPHSRQSRSAVPATGRVEVRNVAGWRGVQLDRRACRLRVPAGVSLDLGAVAKAWAADRAVAAARRAIGGAVLVSIGGDLAVAGESAAGGWLVRVTDEHRGPVDAPGQTIRVASGAIATSSTVARRWRHEGREMHHIIDPATGSPVRSPWRTVSVAAAGCAEANIAATAAIVKGRAGRAWLARLRLPARLVSHDGAVSRVAAWPREEPA